HSTAVQRTFLHDLHEPSAWLRRPLVSITSAELLALERLIPTADKLRPLLELAKDLATHRLTSVDNW
ncbi:MAG: hypothetical protein ABIQ18_21215, partial [Umezawaea sp.]